jgi:hypothetical protein
MGTYSAVGANRACSSNFGAARTPTLTDRNAAQAFSASSNWYFTVWGSLSVLASRDEGGRVGSQVVVSSHRKLLSSRAMVVRLRQRRDKIPAGKVERRERK